VDSGLPLEPAVIDAAGQERGKLARASAMRALAPREWSLSEQDKASTGGRKRRGKKSGGGGGRRRGNGNGRGRGRVSSAYKKRIDERLFGKKGEAGRHRMVERLRASTGTPGFTRIYREYVKGHGMPPDIPTLLLLLDVPEEREALQVIDALESVLESAPSEQKSVLKSRLRNLEMSTSSDALADAASDLLGRL
jgi:hypothetical protein